MGHWTLSASLVPSLPCSRSPYPWPRQTATVATTPAHTVPSRLGHPPLCKPSRSRLPLHAFVSAGGGNTNSHGIIRDHDEDEEFDMEQLKRLANKHGKLLADLTDDEFREACGVRIEVERPSDSSAEDHALLDDALMHPGEEQSDFLNSLSPAVKKRILILKELQTQHNELEIKLFEERAALEAKYQKLYEPLYFKRYDIVNGIVDIESKNEPQNKNSNEENKDEVKGVPNFWLTVMKRNQTLAAQITDRDEDALKYLRDVKSCRIDNPRGFKLDFYFDTNPYFKNSVLTKTYHVIEIDDPIFEQAIGMEIDWYPGKCLTKRLIKKSRKGAKNVKPVTKIEECESFFNFFDPPQVPEDVDNIDKETAQQLHYLFEEDYNIGSTIKDQIIPYAVSWFTGEACQLDDFEDVEGQTYNEED